MQSAKSKLPVVCTDGKKPSIRDTELNDESSTVGNKSHNACKISSHPVSNRKQLHPLVGGPYRNSMRLYLSEPIRSTNKSSVGQRVMSAKMLRVKQLQNQLTDAHYHLNELANENRLLKALQKRQDSALRKYEGTNAELPRIINSHHEELKVLQTKHKKLKTQHKHTCDLLKERENEIHNLQTQNKYLSQLSKDRHLEERDKLQMRVSDLNFRIQQLQETIQTLNRKLALESKSLKQQLNMEVAKHKETQKHLQEALEKLKNLEDLLDNREKRLYYSGRLPVCNKAKTVASQSLMNLGQQGPISNPSKPACKNRGLQNSPEMASLPKLNKMELSDGKAITNLKDDDNEETRITETMSSLQQVRKFRLQRSYSRNSSVGLLTETNKSEEDETIRNDVNGIAKYSSIEKLRAQRATMSEIDSDDEEIEKITNSYEIINGKGPYKLPKQLTREFGYSSSDSESDTSGKKDDEKFQSDSLATKSRDLHTRLIADETTTVIHHSVSSKTVKQKNSLNISDSESDSGNHIKTLSTTIDNYSIAMRKRPKSDNVESSVNDFLKLDINAPDSDLETEGRDKSNEETLEKSLDSPADNLSSGERDGSQQRLLTITKSWTELQAKIKRDREISENQLKILNEGILEDEFLLENKISSPKDVDISVNDRRLSLSDGSKENFEKSHEDVSAISYPPQPTINDGDTISEVKDMETLNVEENCEKRNSLISEDSLSKKTDTANDRRIDREELERVEKKSGELANRTGIGKELSGKTMENGIANENSTDLINYNKQKLLAAMKAIDDNENIDFSSNQKYRPTPVRSQTTATENLYRGLPTHGRKKNDLIKEIFGDSKVENKLRAGCSKLH